MLAPAMTTMPSQMQQEDRRRAEVGLGEDEQRRQRRDRQRREEDAQVVDVLLVVGEVLRQHEDDDQLADLGRLDVEGADVDPAPRAVDPHVPWTVSTKISARIRPKYMTGRALRQEAVVDARDDEAGDHANDGEDQLTAGRALQVREPVPIGVDAAAVDQQQAVGRSARWLRPAGCSRRGASRAS